ncbi:MAG: hypothetical protein ACLP9L_03230 [Thermoguttaceae bacterium]
MRIAGLVFGLFLAALPLQWIVGQIRILRRQQKTSVLHPEIASRWSGHRAFRRRSAARVLGIGGFILLTVWGLRYAGEAGEAFRIAAEDGRSQPWTYVLDPWFVAKTCPQALMLLLAAVVGFCLLLRWKPVRSVERLVLETLGGPNSLDGPNPSPSMERLIPETLNQRATDGARRPSQSWTWIVLGLATVAAALAILEWIEPCYFVQDDNFANVLPGILQGCRSIFHGEFPDFDPCQLMGMPAAGKGAFTLLYPPTIASYAIARWGLGNECYTLEVFAALHLLAGYLASYAAARAVGLQPVLAYVLGISYVLSGYILLVGRSWHAVLTLVFWLPLLFCCMEGWLKGRANWRWLLATGLAIGGFYYMGFAQYWFYGMLLLGLTAVVAAICGRVALRQLIWPLAASLLGLALLLPTLIVQLELTRGMTEKEANFGKGIEQGLLATLAPFPFTRAEGFMGLPANREEVLATQWYYAGTFLMACAFLSMGMMLAYRCRRAWLGQHPWMVAAIVSLWLSLGREGVLWTAIGNLPVIRAVNHHPHRLMPFVVFFSLIAGGIFLERLLRRATSRKWEYWIAAATAILMLYHVSLSRNSLWSYGDRPYPELPQEIAERVLPGQDPQAGRVLSYGPFRTGLPGYAFTLPLSLPSAYGAYGLGGYDPIIEDRPETRAYQDKFAASPMEASRAYAVRWILVANADYYKKEWEYWWAARKSTWCFGFSDSGWHDYREKFLPAAKLRAQREEVSLYEIPEASPMAFDRARPRAPLSIEFHGWGAEVEVPGSGQRTVVVNLVVRPWLKAACGEQRLESSADEWGRMEVRVPQGVNRFQVFYDLPWRRGIVLGIIVAITTLVGFSIIYRMRLLEPCPIADSTSRRN